MMTNAKAELHRESSLTEESEEDLSWSDDSQDNEDESGAVGNGALSSDCRRRGRRSSIKLASLQDPSPVQSRKGSWKTLPEPDMIQIRRSISASLEVQKEEEDSGSSSSCQVVDGNNETLSTLKRRNSVSFEAVHIRSYDQTIGDNPSVSYGPPTVPPFNWIGALKNTLPFRLTTTRAFVVIVGLAQRRKWPSIIIFA